MVKSRLFAVGVVAVAGCSGGVDQDLGSPRLDQAMGDVSANPTGCADGTKGGGETDVDCGGPCLPCGVGRGCTRGTDCQSGACENNKCVAPACDDSIKNGAETDIDCGGGVCPRCGAAKMCLAGTDCESGGCLNNLCRPSVCGNGMKDSDETDLDCGGTACAPCGDGRMCAGASDCVSRRCLNGICRPGAGDMAVGADMAMSLGDMAMPIEDLTRGAIDLAQGRDLGMGGDLTIARDLATTRDLATSSDLTLGRDLTMGADLTVGIDQAMTRDLAVGADLTASPLSFAPPVKYAHADNLAWNVVVADLNGDKHADLLLGLRGAAIFYGKGDGTFGPEIRLPVASPYGEVHAADFNRDGRLDIAVRGHEATKIQLFIGAGNGLFQAVREVYPCANNNIFITALMVGDSTGDSVPDLTAYCSGIWVTAPGLGDGSFGAALGAGLAEFVNRPNFFVSNQQAVLTDLNGDKRLDVLGTWVSITNPFIGSTVGAFLNDAPGHFSRASTTAFNSRVFALAALDANRDGKVDVFAAGSNEPSLLLGKGDGTFQAPIGSPTSAYSIAVADYDRDGRIDVALNNGNNTLQVRLGNGDGTFQSPLVFPSGADGVIATGDFNEDGRPDLVVGTGFTSLYVLLNTTR